MDAGEETAWWTKPKGSLPTEISADQDVQATPETCEI